MSAGERVCAERSQRTDGCLQIEQLEEDNQELFAGLVHRAGGDDNAVPNLATSVSSSGHSTPYPTRTQGSGSSSWDILAKNTQP